MNIVTSQNPLLEWNAYDQDSYDGAEDSNSPVGSGKTEREAINDLVEKMIERAEDGMARRLAKKLEAMTGAIRALAD